MSAESGGLAKPAARGNRPLVIGLTGPIAAGKSTVAELLQEHGASSIDADVVYRSLLHPSSELGQSIVARFGPAVVGADQQIDRAALGELVFRDPKALADLERIAHPAVVAEIRRQIAASNANVVVIEAVKLVESGLLADIDSLWLVTADPEVRLRRLASRRGLTEEQARARMAASSRVSEPDAPIDVVIRNAGDMSRLARDVADVWRMVVGPVAIGAPPEPVVGAAIKEHS